MKKCKFCGKEFKNRFIVAGHTSICEKNPTIIERRKRTRESLIKRYRKINGEIKRFKVKCYKCKKTFKIEERENKFPEKDKYFCSIKCSNSRNIKGNKSGKCEKCGKKVIVKKRTSKYVCEDCKIIKCVIFKKCVICEKKFKTTNKYVKTCSKKCASTLRTKSYKNDKNFANKISKTRKKLFKEGKLKTTGGTTKWFNYKNIKVQGTYELRTCKILDCWKDKKIILDWEYTNDRFEYIAIDGNKHSYLLDFKVFENNGEFYYIEVKGFKKENDNLKWKAVKDLGYKIEVWFLKTIEKFEKEFKIFGIKDVSPSLDKALL